MPTPEQDFHVIPEDRRLQIVADMQLRALESSLETKGTTLQEEFDYIEKAIAALPEEPHVAGTVKVVSRWLPNNRLSFPDQQRQKGLLRLLRAQHDALPSSIAFSALASSDVSKPEDHS